MWKTKYYIKCGLPSCFALTTLFKAICFVPTWIFFTLNIVLIREYRAAFQNRLRDVFIFTKTQRRSVGFLFKVFDVVFLKAQRGMRRGALQSVALQFDGTTEDEENASNTYTYTTTKNYFCKTLDRHHFICIYSTLKFVLGVGAVIWVHILHFITVRVKSLKMNLCIFGSLPLIHFAVTKAIKLL